MISPTSSAQNQNRCCHGNGCCGNDTAVAVWAVKFSPRIQTRSPGVARAKNNQPLGWPRRVEL